jgi:hypothetical protein
MRKAAMGVAVVCVIVATAGSARTPARTGTPPQVQRLVACSTITVAADRLACFDREAAGLGQALAKRDLVVIDRQTTREAKRSLFGFSVPSFGGLFGGGGEDDVKQIEQSITRVGRNPEGGWTVRLGDGSSWTQTDDVMLGLGPRRGDKVTVRRGTLGAFYMSVNGQPGVRVRRFS